MGNKIAISTIMSSIRTRGEWRSTWLTDAELLGYVNDSLAGLHDFIFAIDPWCYAFLKMKDVSFSSKQAKVALPDDIHRLVGVSIADGTKPDGYQVLEQLRWDERYSDGYANSGSKSALRYKTFGDNILLNPIPNFGGVLRIEYAASFPVYSDSSTLLDLINSWQEWVVLDVAIKCCAKEETDPSVYMAQKKDLEARIVEVTKRENEILDVSKSTSTTNSLIELRRSIRNRGAWKREDVTDAQLTEWINSSIKALVDIQVIIDPLLFNSMKDIHVISGTRSYDLPSDVYRVTGVSVSDSTCQDGYQNLLRYQFEERYDYAILTTQKLDARYIILGSKIEFQPTPQWTDTVRIHYVPKVTDLDAPTDTYDFHDGWQEWVILDVCEKIALLKNQNNQMFNGLKREIQDRLTTAIIRDIAKPRVVVDQNRRWNKVRTTRW